MPQSFIVGQNADFELVLRNHGPVAVDNIEIRPVLPRGFDFVKSTPEAMLIGEQHLWKIDKLDPQKEVRIQIRLKPRQVGDARTHARVTFSTTSSTNFQVVEPMLQVEAEGPDMAIVGNQAVFNVTVSNPGSGKAENVNLDVLLPEGLVRTAKSSTYGLGTLNPDESRTIRVVATVAQLGDLESIFTRRQTTICTTKRGRRSPVRERSWKSIWLVPTSDTSAAQPATSLASRTPAPRRRRTFTSAARSPSRSLS